MAFVSDDFRLLIEMVGLALAVATIVWRSSNLSTMLESVGTRQTGEITEIKNALSKMEGVGLRLDKVEHQLSQLQSIVIASARQDERIAAMDQRMLAQGTRIDSTATILNGRLEAINNIVSGHTAQLNMSRGRRDGGRVEPS